MPRLRTAERRCAARIKDSLRRTLTFLPEPHRITLTAREGHSGFTILYDDGHIFEFSAGSTAEFAMAKFDEHEPLLGPMSLAREERGSVHIRVVTNGAPLLRSSTRCHRVSVRPARPLNVIIEQLGVEALTLPQN